MLLVSDVLDGKIAQKIRVVETGVGNGQQW
jgi:hypothetical protein